MPDDLPDCDFCVDSTVEYEQVPTPAGPRQKPVCQTCGQIVESGGFYAQKR